MSFIGGGMWNTQFKGETETVNHDGNTYDVSEIIGSRGRRSNRRALFDSLQTGKVLCSFFFFSFIALLTSMFFRSFFFPFSQS